jgi:hypothetical protein
VTLNFALGFRGLKKVVREVVVIDVLLFVVIGVLL